MFIKHVFQKSNSVDDDEGESKGEYAFNSPESPQEDDSQDLDSDEIVERETEELIGRLNSGIESYSESAKMKRLKKDMLKIKEKFAKEKEKHRASCGRVEKKERKNKVFMKPPFDWTPIQYPCPNQSRRTPLQAFTTGSGQHSKIKVKTEVGDILLYSSRDARLPCPKCLVATEKGEDSIYWRKATLDSEQLNTELKNRPRQHFLRDHLVKSRSVEGVGLRRFAQFLLCKALHQESEVVVISIVNRTMFMFER